MQGADALSATGIRPGDIAQALGEGMARAGRRRAPEPPGRHLQRHRAALPRQVPQHAGAMAMDTARDDAAIGTGRAHAVRPGQDPHAIRCRQNLPDCERAGNEAETGRGHVSTPIGFKATVVRELPASYKPQSAPCLRENQNSTGSYTSKSRKVCSNHWWLLLGSGVVTAASCNQTRNQGAEQGFATSASVMNELEEAEVERQLVLRDAPVRAQPGAQQRPETLDGVDVDLAKPVAILVAGVFTSGVADRLVPVAPDWQAGIDAVFVRVDESVMGDGGGDDRLDRLLLHVGQHAQHDLSATLNQAKDWWLVLFQRAAARRAC